MRRKIGVLIVTLCMIFSMAVSVQAAPLENEEEKNDIEIVLCDENGNLISNVENKELVSQLVNEITGKMTDSIAITRGSCTHIPCNQYEGYLYAHAKVSPTECWVYRMRAIICKCCGGAVKQLTGWEFQYSHAAHW